MFKSSVLLLVCAGVTRCAPECDPSILDKCNEGPEILVYTEIPSIPTAEEGLKQLCKAQKNAHQCSTKYMESCTSGIKKGVITLVLEAMKNEVDERCDSSSTYHDAFFKHVPCINSVGAEVQKCARWAVDSVDYISNKIEPKEQVKTLCCEFPKFIECVRSAVVPKCGQDAGKYAQRFMESYTGDVLEFACGRTKGNVCAGTVQIPGPGKAAVHAPASKTISSLMVILDNLLKQRKT